MQVHDPDAFAAAYDEHHRSVYAAALRVLGDHAEALDVAQDVFLRLWRRPDSFDESRGDVGTYLRMRGRSRALDLRRASQARERLVDRLGTVATTGVLDDGRPDAEVARETSRRAVRAALRGLPGMQRRALVLTYWGGMSAQEVARHERIPLGTAKGRIRLGVEKLRRDHAH